MQLSYNKLRTFNECALKYRLAYVERLPRPPIRALSLHRRLHAALADYHRMAKRDGVVRSEEVLAAYARNCGADTDPRVREQKAYHEGEEILRLYCRNEQAKERVPAYLEHPFRVEFGPYMLTGKIDRLDFTPNGGYSLIDYKLDRSLPSENAAETNRQLSYYSLLVYEGLGTLPEDVRLYYLRHGVEHVSSRSREQLREMVAWVDDTAARIRSERRWRACEGEACRACPFWGACPAKTGRTRENAPVWQQGELW